MKAPAWMQLMRLYGRYFPVQRGKARLAQAAFRRAAFCRLPVPHEPLVARTFSGARMELWPWLWADFATYTIGGPEIFLLHYFRSLIEENLVVLDVGAYIGLYTFAAAQRARRGRVVAFEPDPRSAARLGAALATGDWPQVQMCPCAVGATEEELALNLGAYPPQSSLQEGATPDASGQFTVLQTTLDQYCSAQGITRVDVVKIDTEGAELNVLRGAARVVAQWRPVLVVELHAEQCVHFGYTVADTVRTLQEWGYDLFGIGAGTFAPRLRPYALRAGGRSLVVARPAKGR